jgi:hypothetical protein
MNPNFCRTRDAATPAAIAFGGFADGRSPYPKANTTWPWSDYGAPSPGDLGMLGIEGAELTCQYHVNSFFDDYGLPPGCKEAPDKNEQLREVARRGGLAFLNHPHTGKESLEWYTQLFREHSADYLVGLELAADDAPNVDYNVALWDQLLGELMPSRPIWGFGTSDMHVLAQTRFSFTVLLLDELTTEQAKEAMRSGQFYSVVSPKMLNFSRDRGQPDDRQTAYDGTYPELRSIVVNRDAGEISIDAAGYDEIVWISRPSSGAPQANGAAPRVQGEIVQRGPTFRYADSEATLPYVRAELVRRTDDGPIRLMINPFALARR